MLLNPVTNFQFHLLDSIGHEATAKLLTEIFGLSIPFIGFPAAAPRTASGYRSQVLSIPFIGFMGYDDERAGDNVDVLRLSIPFIGFP